MDKVEKVFHVTGSDGRRLVVERVRRHLAFPAAGREQPRLKPMESWYRLRGGALVWRDDEHHFRIAESGEVLKTVRPEPQKRSKR